MRSSFAPDVNWVEDQFIGSRVEDQLFLVKNQRIYLMKDDLEGILSAQEVGE